MTTASPATPEEPSWWARNQPWLIKYGPGVIGALAAIALGLLDGFVWHSEPLAAKEADPSVWQIVFASPVTLGFFRVVIIGFAIYAVASAVALAASGRWIVKFGGGGIEVETRQQLRGNVDRLEGLEEALVLARAERDRALELARSAVQGGSSP